VIPKTDVSETDKKLAYTTIHKGIYKNNNCHNTAGAEKINDESRAI